MNRLVALISGITALTGSFSDPIIRTWGKPGSRCRSPRYIAGRWVLIDEPRFAMLTAMPRQKARHWLSHNRNKAPRCPPPVSGR